MNSVNLIGRLTKDVDLRYTPNGVAAGRFTLAVKRNYTNQKGERESDFITIVVWRKLAENAANFCVKGSLVGVTGRIETRTWDGQDGGKRYATEVIASEVEFLTPKNNNENARKNQSPNQNKSNANPFDSSQGIDISDEDLPF